MRPHLAFLGAAALGASVAACSLTAGSGFVDCHVDTDCGARAVCAQSYCIPLPTRCERREGSFDTANRIPLVALLPLTLGLDGGAPDDAKVAGLQAMQLAVQEVNAGQGLQGRRFGLIACDTGRDDAEIQRQTAFFVSQLAAPVLVTAGTTQTKAVFEEPHRVAAGTLVLSASATGANLVDVFRADAARSLWRVAPPDTLQAKVLANLITTDPAFAGATRVDIVYQDDAYGQGLASPVREALTAKGRTAIAKPFTSLLTAQAASELVDALSVDKPNVTVMAALPADVVTLVEAIVARGTPGLLRSGGHQWLFTDLAKSPALVTDRTRAELTGMTGTSPAQGAGPAFNDFKERFVARFKTDPLAYGFVAHFYDATYLAMLASAWASGRGHLDGAGLSEGLANVSATGTTPVSLGRIDWDRGSAALAGGTAIDVSGASGLLDFDNTVGAPSGYYDGWRILPDGGIVKYMNIPPP